MKSRAFSNPSVSSICTPVHGSHSTIVRIVQVPHFGEMGEGAKCLRQYSLQASLCEDSAVHSRFLGFASIRRLSFNCLCFVSHLCRCLFQMLIKASLSNLWNLFFLFLAIPSLRLWKWRGSWAGVQDGDHTAHNQAKQRLCPTTTPTEKARTEGKWNWLQWSPCKVPNYITCLHQNSLTAANALVQSY